MKVFLVVAVDYESQPVIAAFQREADAAALIERIRLHAQKRPPYPADVADDAAFARYRKRSDAWVKRHPGGDRAEYFDEFRVESHTLRAPSKPPENADGC